MDAVADDQECLPRAEQHWGFWATVGWVLLVVLIWQIAQTAALVAIVLPQFKRPYFSDDRSMTVFAESFLSKATQGGPVFWSVVFGALVGCGAIALIVRLKRGATLSSYLRIHSVSRNILVIWIGALFVFNVLSWLVVRIFKLDLGTDIMNHFYTTAGSPWLIGLALVVAAPVFEEGLFRGFMFRGVETSFLGAGGAILLSSTVWASIHFQYSYYGMALIWFMGLLLGAARVASRSILVPLALHAISNFSALAILSATGR